MNREDFYNEIIEAVKDEIPEILKEVVSVERIEQMKVNDEKLVGICVRLSENAVAPTIYLDEFFEAYQEGIPAEQIAQHILCMTAEAGMHAPEVGSISMKYEDIEEKLTMQMVEGERNKERLKDLVYRLVDNGMVMIPYIEIARDETDGSYRTAVTKDMALEFDYNIDMLLDRAFDNMMTKNEPAFYKMDFPPDILQDRNPMQEDFVINPYHSMYILTNSRKDEGASVLFYPGLQERIGELLGNNYFALPASLHEFIIVPDNGMHDADKLRQIVKKANATIIPPNEVLSDRVLYFDREKNKLYEPKGRERDGDERGDR